MADAKTVEKTAKVPERREKAEKKDCECETEPETATEEAFRLQETQVEQLVRVEVTEAE